MRPFSFRRVLLQVHLWMGLFIAIPVIAIGLTGSILLLQREMQPMLRPAATATGTRQPLSRIVEAAKTAAPQGTRLGRIELASRPGTAAVVQFDFNTFPQRSSAVFVDPVSLEILGGPNPTGRAPVMASIQRLHEFLWLSPTIGLRVVGYFGIAMTLMGISGLILWWPRKGGWRQAFGIRRGAKGLRLHLDVHHSFGFWGSAIFLVMSVSGLYLTFPETVSKAVQAVLPGNLGPGSVAPGYVPAQGPIDADAAIGVAESAVENAHAIAVQMPDQAGRPVVVYMETEGFAPTIPPLLVTLNPDTAEVNYIDDPRVYGAGETFLNWQYALHFGIGVTWLWKGLVFLSGLLPLVLGITGASIWWLKRRARRSHVPVPEAILPAPAE